MLFKKFLCSVLTLAIAASVPFAAVSAAEADSASVYVTICDRAGDLALSCKEVSVTDTDDDGLLTLNDALYCAHEQNYEGGAAAGYGSAASDFGLSMTNLWGTENGGSYGYYLNNASPMSLADIVSDGDCINAFVYTDLTAWSDTYCFFDKTTFSVNESETLSITLNAAGFDENWAPVTLPVEGAKILLDGKDTGIVTDADGKAVITFDQAGTFVMSASSESLTLVAPASVVTVSAAPASEILPEPEVLPSSGDNLRIIILICIISAIALAATFFLRRKSSDED